MAELTAPQQNRLLGQLANMLRTTEGDIAAPEFLPRGLDVMGLVRQLMLPSAETVEKLSYGDPLFRMPMQSNIPITADREYLADIAGMIPFGAPAARPTARGIQDLVRQIQTEPPTGAISPEIAARVLPETKVVDEAGNPRLLYHGTNKDYEKFSESMLGTKTGNPTSRLGYFFSGSPSEASRYAADWGKEGGNVRPVYLDIKNPKRLTYKEMNDISMAMFDESLPVNAWKTEQGKEAIAAARERANKMAVDLRERLISEGYDGAVVRIGGQDEYIAFSPEQIRSATSDPQMASLLDEPAQSVAETSINTVKLPASSDDIVGNPKINDDFVDLYHVTDEDSLAKIESSGVLDNTMATSNFQGYAPAVQGTYGWSSPERARFEVDRLADMTGSTEGLVILKVRVPKSEFNRLRPDEDSGIDDWRQSYLEGGSAAIEGPIPLSFVEKVYKGE